MNRLAYLGHLLRFAFSRNPLLHLSLALSLVSVVVELAAMSVLFPLSALAIGKQIDAGMSLASGGWVIRTLEWMDAGTSVRMVGLIFFTVFLLRIGTMLASQWLILLLGKRLHAQLSSLAFENIIRSASIKSIDEKSVGYFITLAGDESFRASNLVIAISQFAGIAALGVLYFAAIGYHSPTAAIAVSVFLALCFVALIGTFRKSHRLGALQVEQSQLAGSIFIDALNGLRAVRAMTAEGYVVERYRSEIFRYAITLFRVEFISVLAKLAPVALLLVFSIFLLWNWEADSGAIDPAFIFVLLMFLMRFFPVVGQALRLFMQVLTDARAGRDVLAATAAPPAEEIPRRPLGGPVTSILVRNVAFEYAPDKPVLRGLSVDFVAGKSYAIVGPSGVGKSTLLDLLLGFRDPDAGVILVNGQDSRELVLASLRGKVVLLSQQATIFNDSVLNNILFGAEFDQVAVARASSIAQLDEMVAGLPEGYNTKLAYQGNNLSGGQKQRIGLARALVREPDVLILDESTNALDRETRMLIIAGILREFRDRIVIVITHDLEIAGMMTEVIDFEHNA